MKEVTYGGEKVYYVTLTPTLSKMVETFEKTQKLYILLQFNFCKLQNDDSLVPSARIKSLAELNG
ncbi:hypothetical protein B6D60_08490, partial [candidate division KSB1 bacterium 4484_87]